MAPLVSLRARVEARREPALLLAIEGARHPRIWPGDLQTLLCAAAVLRPCWLLGVAMAVAVALTPPVTLAQPSGDLPHPEKVVRTRVYVSLQPVPRGRPFEVAVVAEILPGFHINANKVLQDYLIPTTLSADLPEAFTSMGTRYPAAQLRKFEFSSGKLAVYDGSVVLRIRLKAGLEARLGAQKLPLVLRYQACNDKACLPPVKIPVEVALEIAPAGARARPGDPKLFPQETRR